jgi:L-amino acid N-acyltransferase YncA
VTVVLENPKGFIVRGVVAEDAEAVVRIYNHYVAETIITFEEELVAVSDMSRRIADVRLASLPWLVAERDNTVVGYAYATKWRARHAYRFSTEVTVYVAPDLAARGIGSMLYGELLAALRARNIQAVMGGIALPNDASVALHEKFGFKKVAHFEKVGFKFNRWIDVGYWQCKLQA